MQKDTQITIADPIPQFHDLRRIPMRYRNILPLSLMKRYWCAVIGSSNNMLTVAISNRQNITVVDTLVKVTGRNIFPVYVSPARMRLLLHRLERGEQRKREQLWRPAHSTVLPVQSVVLLLTHRKQEQA